MAWARCVLDRRIAARIARSGRALAPTHKSDHSSIIWRRGGAEEHDDGRGEVVVADPRKRWWDDSSLNNHAPSVAAAPAALRAVYFPRRQPCQPWTVRATCQQHAYRRGGPQCAWRHSARTVIPGGHRLRARRTGTRTFRKRVWRDARECERAVSTAGPIVTSRAQVAGCASKTSRRTGLSCSARRGLLKDLW